MSTISSITSDIKTHFNFLFDQGFKILSISPPIQNMGNWLAVLGSPECMFRIINEHGEISLDAGPKNQTEARSWFSLNVLVFYISEGRILPEQYLNKLPGEENQYQTIAGRLEEHFDEILLLMGNDFSKHEANLRQAMKDVTRLYMEQYKQYNSGRKAS